MNPNDVAAWAVAGFAAAVVIYIIWSRQHDRARSDAQCERQQLMVDIQRELLRHESVILGRCAELQRKLDDQKRTLRYVSRRLS